MGIVGEDSASEDEEERQSPEDKPDEVSIKNPPPSFYALNSSNRYVF